MSEHVKQIASFPFVLDFMEKILFSIQHKKICVPQKHCIHTDIVPKFSQKVVEKAINKPRIVMPVIPILPQKKEVVPHWPNNFKKVQKQSSSAMRQSRVLPSIAPRPPINSQPSFKQSAPPIFHASANTAPLTGYGKLEPLLNDPSISAIECAGPNKPLVVLRVGQRQLTKIALTPQEINQFLERVSEETHLPLLEGVFLAAANTFSVSAVISRMIGSKFVIKKHVIPPVMPPR